MTTINTDPTKYGTVLTHIEGIHRGRRVWLTVLRHAHVERLTVRRDVVYSFLEVLIR